MALLGPGHVSAHLAGVRWMGRGGPPPQGRRAHRQVFDKVEWYGVVAVCRGQGVGVWVSKYSAEIYAPPVGRGGQGLL